MSICAICGWMFYPQMTQMYADKYRVAREARRATRMASMARDLQTMFRDALELSEGDRATLAGLLIESLEPPPDPEVEKLWSVEAERHWQEIESGAVQTVPWERFARDCSVADDADQVSTLPSDAVIRLGGSGRAEARRTIQPRARRGYARDPGIAAAEAAATDTPG